MSEQDFFPAQGNRFRGSRYSNFASGVLDSQGNVGGVAPVSNPGLLSSSGGSGTDTTSKTGVPSAGLTQMQNDIGEIPSVGGALKDAAIGAGLQYGGQQIGATAGAAMAGGATLGEGLKQGASALGSKVGSFFGGTAGQTAGQTAGTVAGQTAGQTAGTVAGSTAGQAGAAGAGAAGSAAAASAAPSTFGSRLTSASNLGGAAGAGLGAGLGTLIVTGDIKKAAGSGLGTAAGTAIGNAILPGIGGVIGGMLGGALGGRVICTELVRQGLMDASDQRIDMEFTMVRLSNVHARGYLFWARGYVRRMRRSRSLTAFTLKAVNWRLNEIKYQLGMRDKPDYRGKLVRWTAEPFCYAVGLMLQDTPESRIYKKESQHVPA